MSETRAHVDYSSRVGEGTRLWQFSSVIRGAKVGRDCSIGSCAMVDGAHVGRGTTIGHGAFVCPGVWIGERVFVGPGVIFCNDAWPRVDKTGFDPRWFREHLTAIVEDGASIGAGVVVLPGVRIGLGAMIAAGARVERSVPDRHLHKRSGEIVRIEQLGHERMREAREEVFT